ncbi:MAG: CsgG/HfaB family protein [Thermoanaerobaculia bacterium]
MRYHCWIAALGLAAILGSALPAQPQGVKDRVKGLFHPKERAKKKQVNKDLMLSCIQQKAWMAYFKDDEGEVSPLRDTMSTENDEDWLGLRFTDYDGPRIRLGVLQVINKSAEAEENGGNGKIEVPVSGIREMLTVALFNTKRFDVIEQKRVEEVEKQQTRKDVTAPSPATIVSLGKVLDAQYLVYGTVNEWNPERGTKRVGPGGIFGGSKQEAEVAITFVLTDVATGQNLFTTAERARMGEWSFSYGGGQQGTEQKTPVSYAVRACANKAALKIASFLRNRKWKGSIVDVKGPNKVYVNAGSQQGMSPQLLLSVFTVKGIVRDAEGRMALGEDLQGTGTLMVDSVQPGFSIAHVQNGCKGIRKGDRVQLASPPSPPPVPPGCSAMDHSLAP